MAGVRNCLVYKIQPTLRFFALAFGAHCVSYHTNIFKVYSICNNSIHILLMCSPI